MEKFQRRTLQQMDRPCSALLCNCLQFGCCINNIALAKDSVLLLPGNSNNNKSKNNNADWMSHLTKIRPAVKLRDLRLLGSHDAASCTIGKWKPFSAVGITQNGSITQQLEMGVRYLDIRIAGGVDGVSIFHGCLEGSPLSRVLEEIASFLLLHPGEVVVVELVAEHGRKFSPQQKQTALQAVDDVLGDYLSHDDNDDQSSPMTSKQHQPWKEQTISEMVKANKRVVLLIHPRLWSSDDNVLSREEKQRLLSILPHGYDSRRNMNSTWHNTRDCDKLLEWNLEEVKKHGSDRTKLLTNQLMLTPGVGGIGDVWQALVGTTSLRPVSLAVQLIPLLTQFSRRYSREPWNILVMDFVDLVPALCAFWIGINFVDTLDIVKASSASNTTHSDDNDDGDDDSRSTDVTELIQQYVCCNKVLYLIDVVKDLNLQKDTKGILKIQYKLTTSGDAIHTINVPYYDHEGTQIVLSQYIHLIMHTTAKDD